MGDFTATVHWGDGTNGPGTVVSTGGGNYRVDAANHTYVEEGTYTVTVTLKHDALAALTTPNQTIAVTDQQITTPAGSKERRAGKESRSPCPPTQTKNNTDP